MIIYIVKSTMLLALLLGVYKLFLENEKMHTFNRFFLLLALVFGLTAPLISFDLNPRTKVVGVEFQQVKRIVNAPAEIISKSVNPKSAPIIESAPIGGAQESPSIAISKEQVIWIIYGFVTFLLIIRFGYGLIQIALTIRSGKVSNIDNATLVLVNETLIPQSFLKFIFLNEKDFETGKIGEEILDHERTHVRQFHSLDVLFIELIKVVFWFNPILYFYKHAIQLNHEFLADEVAIKISGDSKKYQSLLIEYLSYPSSHDLNSSLVFSLTKKRFLMMRQEFSPLNSYSKSIFLIPACGVLTLLFCTKSIPNSHFSWSGPEGNEVYADVDLVQKPPSYLQFYTLKDELYTGELTLYIQENDQLYSKYVFENGILIGGIIFDENGNQSSRFQHDFENGVRVGFRNYDAHDQILLGWARTHESGDSLTVMREWHPNGQLKFENTSNEFGSNGLMTLYDVDGNILEQELYENGELIEKIK